MTNMSTRTALVSRMPTGRRNVPDTQPCAEPDAQQGSTSESLIIDIHKPKRTHLT
jgi:hypothetical protein